MRFKRAFTLVELITITAILATLAMLAIPNLIRARHNANETAAINSVRTLSTALEAYRADQIPPVYPPALIDLSNSDPDYATMSLTTATAPARSRQGYYFSYNRTGPNSYNLQATPEMVANTGTRRFYVDETGIIRANSQGPAGPGDAEI